MDLKYYIIHGRGEEGLEFQLARLQDESGNTYKGEYDMARHFSSIDELKQYLADDVIKKPASEITLSPMDM